MPTMPQTNFLLASVEANAWAAFKSRFVKVELERGQILHRPGEEIVQVYFPSTALMVLGAETVAGESVNVSLLGPEGAIGVFEACGSRQAYARAMVQIPGGAWRLAAAAYRDLFAASPGLRSAIHRYVESLLIEARQFVACNALHSVENRLARTLLEVSEKSRARHLPITQDALSQLLGVQRTTVAAAVSALQRNGLIRSGRGMIDITDHDSLEVSACSCRETLRFVREDIQSRDAVPCES